MNFPHLTHPNMIAARRMQTRDLLEALQKGARIRTTQSNGIAVLTPDGWTMRFFVLYADGTNDPARGTVYIRDGLRTNKDGGFVDAYPTTFERRQFPEEV